MAWTKSQQKLRDLALAEVRQRGLTVEWVNCDWYSGVSTVVRSLTKKRGDTRGWKVVSVHSACGAFDAILTLCARAEVVGAGYAGRAHKALAALTEAGPGRAESTPLCLLLEDAHGMAPREMERFVKCLEYAARDIGVRSVRGVSVRLVMLMNRVMKWVDWERDEQGEPTGRWIGARLPVWPTIPKRFKLRMEKDPEKHVWAFTRQGLDELRTGASGAGGASGARLDRSIKIA